MFGGDDTPTAVDEVTDLLKLLVTQALLVGKDEHAVLRQVLKLVVKNDVERNLALDQGLLEQHSTLPRKVVVVRE